MRCISLRNGMNSSMLQINRIRTSNESKPVSRQNRGTDKTSEAKAAISLGNLRSIVGDYFCVYIKLVENRFRYFFLLFFLPPYFSREQKTIDLIA